MDLVKPEEIEEPETEDFEANGEFVSLEEPVIHQAPEALSETVLIECSLTRMVIGEPEALEVPRKLTEQEQFEFLIQELNKCFKHYNVLQTEERAEFSPKLEVHLNWFCERLELWDKLSNNLEQILQR
jgi:hypothetical protein